MKTSSIVYSPVRVGSMEIARSHVLAQLQLSQNIKSESPAHCWIALIFHIEVPRVDYEKLSGDRIGESSESIRTRVQAARNIQLQRFSKNGSSDIICNTDMRIGEIRQFCKLQDEG